MRSVFVIKLEVHNLAPDALQILLRRSSPIFGIGTEGQPIVRPGGNDVRSAGYDGAVPSAVCAVSRQHIWLQDGKCGVSQINQQVWFQAVQVDQHSIKVNLLYPVHLGFRALIIALFAVEP